MRMQVQSLASSVGLRIWYCHKLWRRSQMQIRSCGCGVGRQLQLWFDPQPGNFHMLKVQAPKGKKKKFICDAPWIHWLLKNVSLLFYFLSKGYRLPQLKIVISVQLWLCSVIQFYHFPCYSVFLVNLKMWSLLTTTVEVTCIHSWENEKCEALGRKKKSSLAINIWHFPFWVFFLCIFVDHILTMSHLFYFNTLVLYYVTLGF